MAKKKKPEKEEPVNKISNETTDNKENIKPDKTSEASTGHNTGTKGSQAKAASEEDVDPDKIIAEKNQLNEKLAEMQDKYIRLSAEFDNYRKRTLREKIDLSKYAGEELILKILPVMDDFERALSHMDKSTDCSAIKEGIELIYVKFTEFLKQYGVREIDALDYPFDFEVHDAVAKVPVEEDEKKGKVVDVVLKGYYLQEKVIRHSKVVVGE